MQNQASGRRITPIASLLAVLLLRGAIVRATSPAEVLPSAPTKHFNDYASVVSADAAARFDQKLDQFERDTSNQVVVAIYPKMQTDSDVADYTFRIKQQWRVGQKKLDNGVVLFIFTQDHKMFIQVGYGLEGALPDATCKEIIDQNISPRFKANDYEGGLSDGIDAILAATKGEYKGNGRTANSSRFRFHIPLFWWIVIVIVFFHLLAWILTRIQRHGGTFYQNHRRSLTFLEKLSLFFSNVSVGGSSGGGGFSIGGGGGGGGSGGFSGGGGSGGGGGAGGSW